MVTGVARPVTLKPGPVAANDEMVALAFPVLVSVTVCWLLLPTATLPNETLAGLAFSVELVETPIPDIVRVCGEFGALSVKLMLPEAAPVAAGTNCAENVTAWPAESVIGSASPEIPNAFPDTLAILMTTLEFPVLVNFTFCETFWFTVTLPKFQVAGETDSPASAPVPVKEIARGELEASLTTVMVPLVAPETVGAN